MSAQIILFTNVSVVRGKHYALDIASLRNDNTHIAKQFSTLYHRFQSEIDAPFEFSEISHCNYCAIIDNGELFYAFIDNMYYVSPKNTRIFTTIDSFSTYYARNEITFEPCFVARQHSESDELFENLLPENFSGGFFKRREVDIAEDFSDDFDIIIASSYRVKSGGGTEAFPSGVYSGLFQGIGYNICTTVQEAVDAITELVKDNHADSIVSIFEYPSKLMPDANTTDVARTYTNTYLFSFSEIDGYRPKNKKIFTAPFYYLSAYNMEGNSIDLEFEKFDDANVVNTTLIGSATTTPSATLVFEDYNGENGIGENNTLTMVKFPTCAYVIDAYLAWYAQNKNYLEAQNDRKAVATALNLLTLGLSSSSSISASTQFSTTQTGIDAASSTSNTLTDFIEHQMELSYLFEDRSRFSNPTHGNSESDAACATNQKKFRTYLNYVDAKTAKIYDDFWSLYGYPIREIRTPNLQARANYTYCQTSGCMIRGVMPETFRREIQGILDGGATFWCAYDLIGDYTVENPTL